MLLIVGLGNPGGDYARHRHNVGFMAADAIHRRHGFGPWRRRFGAEVAEGSLAGTKTLVIKPQTFMNHSGRAVGEAMNFFKLAPADVLVIHDEVDLPPGKFRMKTGGGVAGHNGLKSVGAAIGHDFRRLRIGVGHPGDKERVPGYVLHDFSKADLKWLEPLLDAIAENAPLVADGKDSTFANRLHEALKPDKSEDGKVKPDKAVRAETESTSEEMRSGRPDAPPKRNEGPLARGLKRLFGGGN
jgi:PTH1 family peptidyl-tRNA hydrolase